LFNSNNYYIVSTSSSSNFNIKWYNKDLNDDKNNKELLSLLNHNDPYESDFDKNKRTSKHLEYICA
jgi:hypothetical protein